MPRRKSFAPSMKFSMSQVRNAFRLTIASAILVTSFGYAAETEITISGWGTLLLAAPDGWRQEVMVREPVVTVAFTPAVGNSFQVMISPLRSSNGTMPPSTPEALRRSVWAGAEHAKSQAVESSIPIHELRSRSVVGSYFSATDRVSKPGEYKYMTQGMVSVEGLPIAFTILSNGEPQAIVESALRMVKSAHKQ
jgi:hypothetical protein